MRAHLVLKNDGGIEFQAKGDSGHQITVGFPEDAGGKDSGPTPMELLLYGAAGCTGIDIVKILEKMKAEVLEFEILIDGQRAEKHPRRFEIIEIEYIIKGKGLSEKNVRRAIELSQEKYCSATNSLNAEIRYSYQYENI
ncbi:MAG: OsmC family protein [Halanaerobiaceae bacterium]|jgi:putative redox protein|nr:OsmC family protein [Halanaerobiaceae bacterium]